MKIEMRKASDLIPYHNNPRINDGAVNHVASSIKEFGWKVPLVIDAFNVIVTGHTRLKAAQKLGLEEVPCIQADDLTPAQIKAFRIADNKTAEFSVWDFPLLDMELAELKEMDFDYDFGFEDDELFHADNEGLTDEDAIPEEVDPICQTGDLWQLGEHRLLCGDATKKEDVERLMDGEKADMALTDPPYNVNYEGATGMKIQNDNMENLQFRRFLKDSFGLMFESMENGASFYIWHADLEGYNFRGAVFDCEQIVRQCLIWVKNSLVMGMQDYQWKHEPCLYGWKNGAGHKWKSDRKQTTVLEFDKQKKNDLHPTMKPVEILTYLLGNNSINNDLVIDLFLGSGSTLIACEKTNRKCYGMEIDPHYCDVIIKRWEDFTGKKAVK